MMIEDFGARVVSVWEGLRSTTRSLIVGALQASAAQTITPARATAGASYDARSDWELSRLLAALDERAAESGATLNDEQARELRRMAEATASVLQSKTQSAEVFAQLVERAHRAHDFARIDHLADVLTSRFAPSELCELVRQPNAVVRALAHEALAQMPTAMLIELLGDPVDAEIARDAIECQAAEYGSEIARQVLNALDQTDVAADDV
jgi:hypothetical protein